MAENKTSFVLYTDAQSMVNKLPDEIAGRLLKHIYAYVNDENPVSEELLLNIAFEPIRMQLKRDLVKWDKERLNRSESGKLGGLKSGEVRRSKQKQDEANEASASKSKQDEANEAVNVNVNVIKDIVSFLNNELGKDFKDNSKSTISLIESRFKEGYTFEDFKKVITTKKANWINTDMAVYLRPSTLFGSKFESYLNEPVKNSGVTIMGLPAEVEYEYFAEYNQKWYSLSAYKNAAGDAPGENIPKRIKK